MTHNDDAWRQSTRDEIAHYYESVFPSRVQDLPDWITPNGPKQYALAFRSRYPAQYVTYDGERKDVPPKDFIRRDTRNDNNTDQVFVEDWDDVLAFLQQPAARDPMAIGTNRRRGLIHQDDSRVTQPAPVPAAAYYALDNWEQFWVLAFDIDAKDVAKQRLAPEGTSYKDITDSAVEESGIINQPPTPHTLSPEDATGDPNGEGSVQAYPYRFADVQQALEYAFDLQDWLLDTIEFNDAKVFYSGQGAHVYAFKNDPYYKLTHQARRFLVTYIRERLHIPIDEAVTWDKNRVMRLPYSLHTGVNRVVTEITSPDFNFRDQALPPTVTGGGPQ